MADVVFVLVTIAVFVLLALVVKGSPNRGWAIATSPEPRNG
jgi:hypothetical protein